MAMNCNVGGADRILRLVLAVVLAAIALLVPLQPWLRTALYVVAAIALVTALIRFCPINRLIGLNTCGPAQKA
jgi:hypothetical protein